MFNHLHSYRLECGVGGPGQFPHSDQQLDQLHRIAKHRGRFESPLTHVDLLESSVVALREDLEHLSRQSQILQQEFEASLHSMELQLGAVVSWVQEAPLEKKKSFAYYLFGPRKVFVDVYVVHRGWVLVRPFVWSHAVGQCRLDLSRRVTPQLLAGLIGRARHDLRTGWRGWAFQRWCCSSRHELVTLPDPLPVFSRVNWSSAREWALSSASAATVCLGATYSPAHFRERDPSKAGCFWPGCSVSVAHFNHVFWECPCRVNPPVFPPGFALPPFLARFGWDCGEDADLVSAVRSWLCCVQDRLWDSRFSGRPPDPRYLLALDYTKAFDCLDPNVLGAVTVSCPRPLADAESSRVASAVRVVRLLSTIGFTLAPFLRTVGQFALSKASFGWVGRGPTLAASGKLWTACWIASSRVHYSSPELRSVLFGGIYHLDCLWACRLVAALLRSSVHALPVWSLKFGTPSAALHGWLLHRGWVLVRPFVWSHAVGQCRLDLSRRVTPQLLAGLIGRARHDLRTGWRGWAFQRWCCSSRHELVTLPDPLPVFSRVNWSSAREWALSSASAATVCLGATYSPAHFRERDPSKAGCFWPGCSVSVAHFNHVFWECPCRVNPPVFPPGFALPPFLARFGWDCGEDADLVSAVRSWLCCVQDRLWDSRFSGRPPDPRS
eukprot:symbB.v1.2.018983.t1/scaffold1531.1/size113404/2